MWSMRDDERFSEAIKLRDGGNLKGALEVLQNLVLRYPENAGLLWCLGHIHWRLGQLEMAASRFKEATEIAPQSERASLGLFHCLWEQGKHVEALDEVKRFMCLADSEDYREIIREINSTDH